ncbi:hypothetical protein O6H91_13G055500 [Diphasiastrum complanatum]|uniref:Uncharacterized protein n=1 Tax=Diphasiastrum complanatum TaxID=34168 RepID=A0ACC2BUX4_DIPCM|nr:hypothetical protein O6H91_13G055500 [Diphasiastrum complanatum]
MDCHPNVPSEIPHLVGPAGDSPFGDGSFSRSNTAFRILPNSLPDDWTPRDTEAVRLRVQVQAPKLRCSASKNRPLVTEPLKIGEEHGSPLGSPLAHDHLLSFHQSPRLLLQDHSANVLKRPPALSHQQAAASRNGKLENSRSISSLWNNDEIAAKDIDTADTPL